MSIPMRQSADFLARAEEHDADLNPADARSRPALISGETRPPVILNLGCGTKTSPSCVNIDWSLTIRVATNPALRMVARYFLNTEKMEKVRRLAPVIPYDLRKGIPYPDNSVDGIYHSHVLEHIDREAVRPFLSEINRVLRPGGVQRIVVPDLERLARTYLADLSDGTKATDWRIHDQHIKMMIEQMVRRQSAAVWGYGPWRRKVDTFLFGDARGRGETHQWMYDRLNLTGLLTEAGFRDVRQVDYKTSRIADWASTRLDVADDGVTEYKPESIYVESVK